MSSGGRYNVTIQQGSTFGPLVLRFRNTIVLAADAVVGDTTLSVSPLSQAITLGATLVFGTVSVITTAAAVIGDRTLAVQPISSAIAKGTTAKGDPIDLTGKQVRAQIRQNFSDPNPLASFTCAIVSPTGGEISISLPSDVSSTLLANIHPDKADDLGDIQASTFPSATDLKLFLPGFAPFYYDIEVHDSATPPIVQRYIYGRVLVSAEATK